MFTRLIILFAVTLAPLAQASSIFKCVDAAGKVTFTQNQNCPSGHVLGDVVSARSAPPSGSSAPVQMADPNKPRAKKSQGQRFVVVGEQPPTVTAPVVKSESPSKIVVRPANQPCVKVVDQKYSYSKPSKNGGTVGTAGVRKVVVPC